MYTFHLYQISGVLYDTNGNTVKDTACARAVRTKTDAYLTYVLQNDKVVCRSAEPPQIYDEKAKLTYYNEYVGERCTRLDYSNDPEEICRHITAMVNSEYGGDIYVGVENGLVVGANNKKQILKCTMETIPHLDAFWKMQVVDVYATTEINNVTYVTNKPVAEIYRITIAPRVTDENITYYTCLGKYYTRCGGATVEGTDKYENYRAPHVRTVLHNSYTETQQRYKCVMKPVITHTAPALHAPTTPTIINTVKSIVSNLKAISGKKPEMLRLCIEMLNTA